MRLLAAALLAAAPALAQQRPLSIDDLYGPDRPGELSSRAPTGLEWLGDGEYAWPHRTTAGVEVLRVDALSGRSRPLFDAGALRSALVAARVDAAEAARAAGAMAYPMDPARRRMLVTAAGDLWSFGMADGRLLRLTTAAGAEELPAWSRDGRLVAFVRANDLYVVDAASAREQRLTRDGSASVLNGKLDWLYQEEIYGRGTFTAFWWSPDSRRVAFLRLDETRVPRYTLYDDVAETAESTPYPRPGEPNPGVRVGVASLDGAEPVWLDAGAEQGERLVVDVSWTPEGREVCFEVQDRAQTWLDLRLADAITGRTRTLLRETTPAWVERSESPRWLADGGFLWTSERTGARHVYRYSADAALQGAVTAGAWAVRGLLGVDEPRGFVYFTASERSPVGVDVYRVRLDGRGLARLSAQAGTHAPSFNPGLTLYLDTWSNLTTPPQVRLHHADGALARAVYEDGIPALERFRLSTPEIVSVRMRDGVMVPGLLVKPLGFDPAKRYPVYQHVYGGPHSPQVNDAWGGGEGLFYQVLAARGVAVWVCDNRSSMGGVARPAWPIRGRLGELELRDVEDGLQFLKAQPWVDGGRIGIEGWSYGGFMVAYALTHSPSFAMGIAGGPVTDWHDYDSVYTERMMGLPKDNPDGYARSAVVRAARDLHGALLLVHGTVDDNVHPENTLQLAHALQVAGLPFRMMLYPRSRHGVYDPLLALHMRRLMLDFVDETLRPAGATRPGVANGPAALVQSGG